MKHEKLVSALD